MNLKKFTNPTLTPYSLDTFITRCFIIGALKKMEKLFSGTVLDIGCGYMPYREIVLSFPDVIKYIGLDLDKNDIYQNKPDLTWDGKTIPLPDNSVRCAVATEFFEHCPEPEAVMEEIFRVLSPGGILFFTVPYLWPLHDVPHDQYRYTPFSLERHLKNTGFQKIGLRAMGGWDESMAQMIGLYVRRRPMPDLQRFVLSLFVFPFVYVILKSNARSRLKKQINEAYSHDFYENDMFAAISGIAYKPGI